jgi:hypothetical protein
LNKTSIYNQLKWQIITVPTVLSEYNGNALNQCFGSGLIDIGSESSLFLKLYTDPDPEF